MRWTPGGRSRNLEDRRGARGAGVPLGIGGTLIVLVLGLIFGPDVVSNSGLDPGVQTTSGGALAPADSAREEPAVQFVSFVLDDAQRTWARILPEAGVPYEDARLVLFRDAVRSGCGAARCECR